MASKKTAGISAHGSKDSIFKASNYFIKHAVEQRAYGLPGVNVVFAASCSTAHYLLSPLAEAYGIVGSSQDKVYVGFTDIVYIAGAQAAARVFWNLLKEGSTAFDTNDKAMKSYQEELTKVEKDTDLLPYLVDHRYDLHMRFNGDASTKLHGLYNLPTSYSDQNSNANPPSPLVWMVSYTTDGQTATAIQWFQ